MTTIANIMIPSVTEHLFIMLLLLIPVVLIEGAVLARRHLLPYLQSIVLALKANLKSTFVGIPLGYLCALLGIIPLGIFAALLPENIRSPISNMLFHAIGHGGTIPDQYDEFGYYAGTLLILFPYYYLTVRVERKLLQKLKPELDEGRLAQTVKVMNGITYMMLGLPVLVATIWALIKL